MSALSDYAENALFNHLLRNVPLTSPTTVYVALFTSNPTDAGTGTEVSVGNYVRQPVTFGAPSNGVGSNSGQVLWDPASVAFVTITHVGIYDASTSGNLLMHAALNASKVIGAGDIFRISVASLVATFA
jgi:hypothetical protein